MIALTFQMGSTDCGDLKKPSIFSPGGVEGGRSITARQRRKMERRHSDSSACTPFSVASAMEIFCVLNRINPTMLCSALFLGFSGKGKILTRRFPMLRRLHQSQWTAARTTGDQNHPPISVLAVAKAVGVSPATGNVLGFFGVSLDGSARARSRRRHGPRRDPLVRTLPRNGDSLKKRARNGQPRLTRRKEPFRTLARLGGAKWGKSEENIRAGA